MLTLEECVALSDLTRDEIDAIALHEHVPQIVAVEMGFRLVHLPGGTTAIKEIIRDDITAAQTRGDTLEAAKLKLVLKEFVRRCRTDVTPCDSSESGGGPSLKA